VTRFGDDPFSLLFMSFCFKLDGSPASAEVLSGSRSYLSTACANRLGLSFSGGSMDVAVSVKIGDSWATCVVSRMNTKRLTWCWVETGRAW